jgi:hypothetical protein
MEIFHNEIISFCLRKATIKLASDDQYTAHLRYNKCMITKTDVGNATFFCPNFYPQQNTYSVYFGYRLRILGHENLRLFSFLHETMFINRKIKLWVLIPVRLKLRGYNVLIFGAPAV